MSEPIKATVYRILKAAAITAGGIYQNELPKNPTYPVTVYHIISETPVELTHDIGTVGFRQARVQIEVYALSVKAAEEAMEAYFDLLKSYSGTIGDGKSPETFTQVDIWDEGRNPDLDFQDEIVLHGVTGRSRDFTVLFR